MSVECKDLSQEEACVAGISCYQAQRIDDAVEIFHHVLGSDPTHARALNALAIIARDVGDPGLALDYLNTLLSAHPTFDKGYNTRGTVLLCQGDTDAAIENFYRAIALNPSFAEAYGNLGDIHLQQRSWDEAIICYRKVSVLLTDSYLACYGAGRAYSGERMFREAIECLRKALTIKPDFIGAHIALGDALRNHGQLQEAAATFQAAIRLNAASAAPHNGLGNVFKEEGNLQRAEECYRKALRLEPAFYPAELNLASLYWLKGKLHKVAECYARAARFAPDSPLLLECLGSLFLYRGLADEAVAELRRAVDIDPENAPLHSALLLAMHYSGTLSPAEIFTESREWNRRHSREMCDWRASGCNPPFRIGYVSPDFRQHPINYFFKPLLAAHDRPRFRIYCYSDVAAPDDKTRQLAEMADCWVNIAGMEDKELAERIVADGIDILVDLAGHTANNRLQLFTMKPAPVQVTWLGYPATTGLNAMDYRISDGVADPEGITDGFHTETIIRVSDSFLCYSPPVDSPEVSSLPALHKGFITFGSFNNLPKMTTATLTLWGKILNRVPGSRLLLKTRSFGDEITCRRISGLLEAEGVDSGRILLLPYVEGVANHLTCYGEIDIALDTFPYNGTTTTCEALWMGVPVITLAGDHHAARVGASILFHAGLQDLVADTVEEYIAMAEQQARDLNRLSQLRQTLRERLLNSVLCDAKAFARSMEDAYLEMMGESL